MRVKSKKGHELDMNLLIAKNENVLAVGNARLNARGDVVGLRGEILKSREDVAAEYHRMVAAPVKHVPLKELAEEVYVAPKKAPEPAAVFLDPAAALKEAEATAVKATKQRKITDSED